MGRTGKRPRIIDRNACVSVHDMVILRRATLAISLSTWTLIVPPSPISCSARSAFVGSSEMTYNRTLVSKKLPGIRLFPVELEVGRKPPAEGAQALQQLITPGLARNAERAAVGHVDFDVIAGFKLQRLDHGGGKTDSEAVAPFGDVHGITQ